MADADPQRLLRRNATRNRETRDAWDVFAGHRERVMSLIECLPPGKRLGILGAGNANDVALARLLERFDDVHLVDLDFEALARGVAAQRIDPASITLHGGIDLTGVADLLDRWSRRPPDDADVDAGLRRIRQPPEPELVGGAFDVLVSACVLTQLIDGCVDAVGMQHPRVTELVLAVRDQHLRTLVGSTCLNGTALLITDMVSSDTASELTTLAADQLAALATSCIEHGNFFTGTNPSAVHAALTSNPALAPLIASIAFHGPWRWNLGRRSFLVYALSIRRR